MSGWTLTMNIYCKGLLILVSGMLVGCVSSSPVGPRTGEQRPRLGVMPRIEVDAKAGEIVCRDSEGRVQWTTRVTGRLPLISPHHPHHTGGPETVTDGERIFAPVGSGITSLDIRTGEILWQSDGPNSFLVVSDDLLLAAASRTARPSQTPPRPVLVARDAKSGAMAFSIDWATAKETPFGRCRVVDGLILLESWDPETMIVDLRGRIQCVVTSSVASVAAAGSDLIVTTPERIRRIDSAGSEKWRIPLEVLPLYAKGASVGGGLRRWRDGSVLAYAFSVDGKSGIQLVRFDPRTGKQFWQAWCTQDSDSSPTSGGYAQHATVSLLGPSCLVATVVGDLTITEVRNMQDGALLTRAVGPTWFGTMDKLRRMQTDIAKTLLDSKLPADRDYVVQAETEAMVKVFLRLRELEYHEFLTHGPSRVIDMWGNDMLFGFCSGKPFVLCSGADGKWSTVRDNIPHGSAAPALKILLEKEIGKH